MIKVLVIDRDGVINHHSSDPTSPFYYILDKRDLVLKPNVPAAFSVLETMRRHTGLKVILATKQRCISKGLITRKGIDDIHWHLEQILGFTFDRIYIEHEAETKAALFAAIIQDNNIKPWEMTVIDDSFEESKAAYEAGCSVPTAKDGLGQLFIENDDLFKTVKHLFKIS